MDNLETELSTVIADMEAEVRHRVDARKATLEERVAKLKDDRPDGPEVALGFDIKVDWKDVPMIFHLPSVTMKDHRVVIGLPEVTMRDRDLIFHTPSVRMVSRKIGQYPEFHGFTVRWKDIIVDVPEPFMQEQRIRMGIPEFALRDRDIVLGLPSITMVESRIVLRLPQFTIREVSVIVSDMKSAAEDAKRDAEAGIRDDLRQVGGQSQQRIVAAVNRLFGASRDKMIEQRDQGLVVFDNLANALRGTLADLRGRQAQGDVIGNLETSLQKALNDRQTALDQFAEQLTRLETQERQVIADMIDRLAFRLPDAGQPQGFGEAIALAKRPLGRLHLVTIDAPGADITPIDLFRDAA